MSNEHTYPLISGRVMRGTRVDSCGVPVYGDTAMITTDGFVSVAVSPQYNDGTEINIENAHGRRCVHRDAESELTNLALTIVFCAVDPEFFSVVTGFPVIVDSSGDAIGYRINRAIRPSDVRFALEVWMDAFADSGCDDSGEVPYGYNLWPFLSGGKVGDWTIEHNAVTFTVSALLTKDGTSWGIGPYDVAADAMGAAQALYDAADAKDHQISFKTTIAPPEATNGLMPLDDPDGADATTATAGTPGTFNGVRPYDIAALQASSITGSGGVTAWTTGQFVYLGNGTKAHWAGSGATPKWVAGAA